MIENPYISRDAILQYCLNQGTGIEYKPEDAETTEKEIQDAEKENRKVRYVATYTTDVFCRWARPQQVAYAVTHNMDLRDFDDWQVLQDLMGIEMPYTVERKIESLLSELDIYPIEIDIKPEFRNVIKQKFDDNQKQLSVQDCVSYLLYTEISEDIANKIDAVLSCEFDIHARGLVIGRISNES